MDDSNSLISESEKSIEPENKEKSKIFLSQQRIETSFNGPIPPPNFLEKYNNIIPNGAERILAMAEQQQAHRQYMEKTVVESDVRRSDRGLILGFIVTLLFGVGGIYLVAKGHNLNGLATILAPLVTLVGTFIYSQKNRKEERIERSKTISEKNAEKNG